MKRDIVLLFRTLFPLVLEIIGYALLFSADWRIALGVLLLHWRINVGKSSQDA